ncbi:MAG: diguanylate cyclase [Pseudomonadales bacterium]|nr:diguanylate cyclase [Pseudomonadales bacterium]
MNPKASYSNLNEPAVSGLKSLALSNLGLTTKVALVLLTTNLIAVLATGLLYYQRHQNQLLETVEKHFHSVAQQESQLVNNMLAKSHTHIQLLANQLRLNLDSSSDNAEYKPFQDLDLVKQKLDLFKTTIPEISNVVVMESNGNVLMSTNPALEYFELSNSTREKLQEKSAVVMDLAKKQPQHSSLILTTNLRKQNDEHIILLTETALSELADLVDRHIGLGYTEETMLLYHAADGGAKPIVPLKFTSSPDVHPQINPFNGSISSQMIKRYVDYRGEEVFAISQMVPNTNWALVFKIDTQEALAIVHQQRDFLLLSLVTATLAVFIVAIIFARSLTMPLTKLTQVAQMIAEGNLAKRIQWASNDEIGVLAAAFNSMANKLIRGHEMLDLRVREKTRELAIANENLAKANRDLERITLEDPLTQISNRRAFDQAFHREWKRSSRSSSTLSLLMIDIDHFKQYNDTLGHHAGDDCLIQVASILARICQRDNDLVARYGGEEFVILLPETSNIDCETIATRIVKTFAKERLPHPASPIADHVTVSIGFGTHIPSSTDNATVFFEQIDAALYKAKELGRNQAQPIENQQEILLSQDKRKVKSNIKMFLKD